NNGVLSELIQLADGHLQRLVRMFLVGEGGVRRVRAADRVGEPSSRSRPRDVDFALEMVGPVIAAAGAFEQARGPAGAAGIRLGAIRGEPADRGRGVAAKERWPKALCVS